MPLRMRLRWLSGMNRLATEGDAIGLQRLTDDKGKLSGIGEHFKQFTTLTQMMLDEEANYDLFSAVTHGHLWAASQLGLAGLMQWERVHRWR